MTGQTPPPGKPVAQLPLLTVDVSYGQPAGKTWACHTATDLKNALTSSSNGDTILLDPGVIYSGNFIVRPKAANGQWLYITTAGFDAKHPVGTKVTPADSPDMAKIVSPNVSQALAFGLGSNHVHIEGVEIYSNSNYKPSGYIPGVYYGYAMVAIYEAWPWTSNVPDHIFFDRCYVHGDATHDVQAAIQANFSYFAIIDSYVSDIHMKGTDTTAVGAFFSPGPFLIQNNHLEAAGENVIFGGSGQNYNLWVPSDITITGNDLYKPLSWVVPSTSGGTMVEKNALELKSAQRLLFDSNTIENVWSAGQLGFAVVLTVRSGQSGDIAVVNDITVTNNIVKNVVSFVNTIAKDDTCGPVGGYPNCHNAGSQDRWNISNNLVLLYDPTIAGGNRNVGISLQPGIDRINNQLGVLQDVVFQHNTLIPSAAAACWNAVYFGEGGQSYTFNSQSYNIWIQDNVLCRQPTGDWTLGGTTGLTRYMGNPSAAPYGLAQRFYGNVMYVPSGDRLQSFPVHNYATSVPFTYLDPSLNDYQLVTPYWTDTSDGQLAGYN